MLRVFVRFDIQLVRMSKRMVNVIDTMLFRSRGTFINGDAYRRGTARLSGYIRMSNHRCEQLPLETPRLRTACYRLGDIYITGTL